MENNKVKRNEKGQFMRGFKCPREWITKKVRPKGLKYKVKVKNKGWFEKGIASYNKGKKGLQRVNSGSFKKGARASPKTEFKKGDKRIVGKNNSRWKGGITPKSVQLRHSNRYIQWRKTVFTRDNYTCQKCGIYGVGLHAHHIVAFSKLFGTSFQDYIFNIKNGVTLCEKCHQIQRKFASQEVAAS